jgi:tRNA-specific adenosine deaminase 1
MKCLPTSQIESANGNVLHDWHAEVLAIRVLNHYLLEQCHELCRTNAKASEMIRRREPHEMTNTRKEQAFTIKDSIKINMYCSEAPCGDASMELTMADQADATPWAVEDQGPGLRGRGSFSELGIVRRKPCKKSS